MISAYCNLRLPGSSDSPASVFQVAESTGMHHHTWLIFVFSYRWSFTMWARLVSRPQQMLQLSTKELYKNLRTFQIPPYPSPFTLFTPKPVRQCLTLSPRLECSGITSAHYNLPLPDLSNSGASASPVAEITGMCHHAWLIFVFLVEMGFHHVGHAGLELLTSSDPLTLASHSVGITEDFSQCSFHKIDNSIIQVNTREAKIKWQK
ncbi:hypothetical protein AAY473_031695 [Plecturocebus cupreus]